MQHVVVHQHRIAEHAGAEIDEELAVGCQLLRAQAAEFADGCGAAGMLELAPEIGLARGFEEGGGTVQRAILGAADQRFVTHVLANPCMSSTG